MPFHVKSIYSPVSKSRFIAFSLLIHSQKLSSCRIGALPANFSVVLIHPEERQAPSLDIATIALQAY